jgi:hypothetical protein
MIDTNGIANTLRIVLLLALALSSCAREREVPPGQFDARRTVYVASSETVQVGGVELRIESCSLAAQCDFILQMSNKSERCVAFSELSLPGHSHVWLDATFNVTPRITSYPAERVRRTFVVLQPGEQLEQGVDFQAITGIRDLSNSRITFTSHFFECAGLIGVDAESFELVSASITFEPVR